MVNIPDKSQGFVHILCDCLHACTSSGGVLMCVEGIGASCRKAYSGLGVTASSDNEYIYEKIWFGLLCHVVFVYLYLYNTGN